LSSWWWWWWWLCSFQAHRNTDSCVCSLCSKRGKDPLKRDDGKGQVFVRKNRNPNLCRISEATAIEERKISGQILTLFHPKSGQRVAAALSFGQTLWTLDGLLLIGPVCSCCCCCCLCAACGGKKVLWAKQCELWRIFTMDEGRQLNTDSSSVVIESQVQAVDR